MKAKYNRSNKMKYVKVKASKLLEGKSNSGPKKLIDKNIDLTLDKAVDNQLNSLLKKWADLRIRKVNSYRNADLKITKKMQDNDPKKILLRKHKKLKKLIKEILSV